MIIELNGKKIDSKVQVEKWEKWALTPTGRSHKVISENIKFLYEQAKLKPVPVIVCESVKHFEDEINNFAKKNVHASVRTSVWTSVWASVRTSVWASVGAYYNADDISFIDTFLQLDVKIPDAQKERFYKNVDAVSDSCMAFLSDKVAIILIKPTIYRDNQKHLHREDGRAVEWGNDGYYFLHGVRFEKSLWESVVGKKMTFTAVMGIVDIDQRWVALKFMDTDTLLKGAKAKLLDSSKRNSLYLVEGLFPTAPKAYFLRYSCPSTGRVYLSGIAPEIGERGNADACQAWKHGFTLEEYNQLIAEY